MKDLVHERPRCYTYMKDHTYETNRVTPVTRTRLEESHPLHV